MKRNGDAIVSTIDDDIINGEKNGIRRPAYSALLRSHQEKNRALLLSALQHCEVDHLIFLQIYFLDLIANYAAMVYPLYARLPPAVERISISELTRLLAQRAHFRSYCDVGTGRVVRAHTIFWDAEKYLMSMIKEGQMGYFKSKPTENDKEILSPFLVVWKHPQINDDVHVLGVIFPFVEYETKTINIPQWNWTYPPTQQVKTATFGGDLSSVSSLYTETMDAINHTACTCSLVESMLPEHHLATCAKKRSYVTHTHEFFQHPQLRQPPKDGYYKVHYFAFWAEPPNEIGSEVCASAWDPKCLIYELQHTHRCHFVTVTENWPHQHTKDIRKYNPDNLALLPFAFNPDSIHLKPDEPNEPDTFHLISSSNRLSP